MIILDIIFVYITINQMWVLRFLRDENTDLDESDEESNLGDDDLNCEVCKKFDFSTVHLIVDLCIK